MIAAVLLVLAGLTPVRADAKGIQLIRDAEIENIIRAYATPLFQAAGLSPQAIDVYLVRDRSLNAFVTSGLNMFIHTGLLMRAADPLQVIGVIAHETGHLASGHTATRGDSLRSARNKVIASYLLGLGAVFATGRPEFARAAISGGQDIALKGLLRYTRSQETAADQAAVGLLNGTGQSPRGLLEFIRVLGGQEVLLSTNQDPYLRTHPLARERISFLEDQVRRSPHGNRPARPEYVEMHARMHAKLTGFLEPFSRVLQKYPESDASMAARYARAIAHFRKSDLEAALPLTDALIAERPDDPYFRELKGQMLFENGRIAEAVPEFEAAVRLLPDSPQIRLALAQAQIEMNDPELDRAALEHLSRTLHHEPGNAFAWRLSAIAYGRRGEVGMTALALAESALAHGKAPEAGEQAVRAQRILAEGSPGWLRAVDIEQLADRLAKKQ
ncbi:MAG: M48 family metalloprotease [Kiloniellaceae bacterium]